MSSYQDPPRLRSMGAELPEGLAAALEADRDEFPQAAQLSDLTNRLAPLLETATATAAVAIPVGLMAPKAPLSLAGTLKLLAVKWGHTVIVPMVIGAASGGVVWEAHEYVASNSARPSVVTDVAQPPRVSPSPSKTSLRALVVSGEEAAPTPESAPADREPAAPARSPSALGPALIAAPAPSGAIEPPPTVAWADELTEIELIDRAQRALAHQPKVARQWLDEHMRRFPDGTFVQERETVAIEALAREGRLVEARARASEFRTRFPQSTYLRRIDAVLRGHKTRDSQ